MKINKEEKKMLIELICNEQTHMIIKDHTKYESDKYKKLEELNDVDIMEEKGYFSVPVLEVDGTSMDFKTANDWINSLD